MADFSQEALRSRKRLRPKTYSLGLYVVGFFILLEIVALMFIFWIRQEVRIETNAPVLSSREAQFLDLNDSRIAPEIDLPNLPKPEIEARLDLDLKRIPELDIAKLNEDARKFRRQGEFHMADAALKQALEIDPRNVLTLTNLAMLEEARGDTARALKAWREVIRAGSREKSGSHTTVELARERAKIIEQRFRLEEETEKRRAHLSKSEKILTVHKILTDPDPEPENPLELKKSFYLRKNENRDHLSVSKVRIQLYFYERTPENHLIPAQITAKFDRNPPEWSGKNGEEVLTATYLNSSTGDQRRRYFGYLIRIYYDEVLQDERAEPGSLLRLFPKEE